MLAAASRWLPTAAYLERELARGPWCLGDDVLGRRPLPLHAGGLGELRRGRLPARRRPRARALSPRGGAARGRPLARAGRPRRAPAALPPGAACRPADLDRYRRAHGDCERNHASARAADAGRARARRRSGAGVPARGRGSSRSACTSRPRPGISLGSRVVSVPPAAPSPSSSTPSAACTSWCATWTPERLPRSAPCAARDPRSRRRTTQQPPRPCGPMPGWREAMRRRGVEDVSLVQIDVLASGGFGLEVERGRRVARAVAYLRDEPGDNGYARPVESLIAYVDVDECRVLELEEMDVKPIPEADGAYARGHGRRARRSAAHRDLAAGGRQLHGRRQRDPLVPLVAARGNRPAGGARAARRALRRPAGAVPRLVRRDDRPVRRAPSDALVAHLLRCGRVRPRRMRELARSGLRLRRRDPLPRRASRRPRRAPARRAERDLPARGGRRPALEAQRRARRAASSCGGRGASCSTRW